MGNDFSPEVRIAALQRVPIFGGISEEVIAFLLEPILPLFLVPLECIVE